MISLTIEPGNWVEFIAEPGYTISFLSTGLGQCLIDQDTDELNFGQFIVIKKQKFKAVNASIETMSITLS